MNEKILVIDDEPDIRNLLATALLGEGYEVVAAEDGEEEIARFREIDPDLIVTDVKMPKKSGLAVLQTVRGSGSGVDVIILTGHSDEATAISCLRQGAYDYLLKPLEDIDVILMSVKRALQKRQLEKEKIALMGRLEEMAVRDALTGLYNVRTLHAALDEEIIRAERYTHPFCVLMIDIDHFKAVNDTCGHPFGDYVLKELATVMGRTLRTTDRLYRYGGEEFLAVMPETPPDDARRAVDRLCEAVKSHDFVQGEMERKITISAGGAFFPFHAVERAALIRLADEALYEAKNAGRDRAVFAPLPQE
ncbi:MAG: diguanylate cyclase [Candidatus Omnitrophota bacterium]|nr:diguanylate cyclase [Candidatus Omnitrophota bacterium]